MINEKNLFVYGRTRTRDYMIIFQSCVRYKKVRGVAFATTRVDHEVATGMVVGRRLQPLQHRAPP